MSANYIFHDIFVVLIWLSQLAELNKLLLFEPSRAESNWAQLKLTLFNFRVKLVQIKLTQNKLSRFKSAPIKLIRIWVTNPNIFMQR
jgi:hypothetical protein